MITLNLADLVILLLFHTAWWKSTERLVKDCLPVFLTSRSCFSSLIPLYISSDIHANRLPSQAGMQW